MLFICVSISGGLLLAGCGLQKGKPIFSSLLTGDETLRNATYQTWEKGGGGEGL